MVDLKSQSTKELLCTIRVHGIAVQRVVAGVGVGLVQRVVLYTIESLLTHHLEQIVTLLAAIAENANRRRGSDSNSDSCSSTYGSSFGGFIVTEGAILAVVAGQADPARSLSLSARGLRVVGVARRRKAVWVVNGAHKVCLDAAGRDIALGNLAGVVRGRALQGGVEAPVHAVAADDDLAGLGQAYDVRMTARRRGILTIAKIVRAHVIIVTKGVEGVGANVAGSIAAADIVGARVAVVTQDGEHGLVRCAISCGGVALLGTTCVSTAVVGDVQANCFSAICHTGVICARIEVIATNAINFALAINFAAGLGIARVGVVALDAGEQAGGLAADVRARVVGALVGVLAHHGHDLAAGHAIAHIGIANITRVLAGDGGVLADGYGEGTRVVDGARVVGARVVVVAIVRGYWARSGTGIASPGIARIAPGARAAFAHGAELVDESVRALASGTTGIGSARVSIIARLVPVDTSGGSAALSDVASMEGRARNVIIRAHSISASVLRASVSVVAVHRRTVLASTIGSIANLREALVRGGAVDWGSSKLAGCAIRDPIVGASSRWVASIVRARVVVVAVLGSEDAAGTVLACINRAHVVVVADHRRVIDSGHRVATIVCASHAIINGDVGVVTTGRVAAQVLGTRIVIVARSGDSLAAIGR